MSLVTPRLCSEPQTCCGCVYLYCSSTACGCEDDEGEVVFSQLLCLCSADGGKSEQTVSPLLKFTSSFLKTKAVQSRFDRHVDASPLNIRSALGLDSTLRLGRF